jgi:hypothetical protein
MPEKPALGTPSTSGFDRRDVALMLLGIAFGILGQVIYDVIGTGLQSLEPSLPNWGRLIGGTVVFFIFFALAWSIYHPTASPKPAPAHESLSQMTAVNSPGIPDV